MSVNKTSLTSISKASTVEEISDFWDEHRLDEYWDQTKEVAFEVRAQQRRRVTLAPEIYEQIQARAQAVGLLPETLVMFGWRNGLRKRKLHSVTRR